MNSSANSISISPSRTHSWLFLLLMMSSVFIGMAPIFVRLTQMGPLSMGFHRFFLSLPLIWGWASVEKRFNPLNTRLLDRKTFSMMLLAGIFFAVDIGLWNASAKFTRIANAALFNNLAAFFVPFILWIFFAQRPKLIFSLAVITALVGCFFLTKEDGTVTIKLLWGDIFAILSAVAASGYVIIVKRLRERVATSLILWWTGIVCATCLGFFALIAGENLLPPTPQDWLILVGQAIFVHIGGQGISAFCLGMLSAPFTTLVMLMASAVASGMAWILFSEAMSPVKISGGLLIFVSILAAHLNEKKTSLGFCAKRFLFDKNRPVA